MARVVFANGSKKMAHNLDDLWDRWVYRREILAKQGIEDFVCPPKPQHMTSDIEIAAQIVAQAKVRKADLGAAKLELTHKRKLSSMADRHRYVAIEAEILYWKQVLVRLKPLAKAFYDIQESELRHTRLSPDVLSSDQERFDKADLYIQRLRRYAAYLQTVIYDLGGVPIMFEQWHLKIERFESERGES